MSRLDDELRKALSRQEPSVHFTARVLERLSHPPEPEPNWWQRLTGWLSQPKQRWVAIGVTASLLLAVVAVQYSRRGQPLVDNKGNIAQSAPSHEATGKNNTGHVSVETTQPSKQRNIKRPAVASASRKPAKTRINEDRTLRSEGEAAKEKLMVALFIASSALNHAQKAVQDEGPKP
jgi:hypothetical protein